MELKTPGEGEPWVKLIKEVGVATVAFNYHNEATSLAMFLEPDVFGQECGIGEEQGAKNSLGLC